MPVGFYTPAPWQCLFISQTNHCAQRELCFLQLFVVPPALKPSSSQKVCSCLSHLPLQSSPVPDCFLLPLILRSLKPKGMHIITSLGLLAKNSLALFLWPLLRFLFGTPHVVWSRESWETKVCSTALTQGLHSFPVPIVRSLQVFCWAEEPSTVRSLLPV